MREIIWFEDRFIYLDTRETVTFEDLIKAVIKS